ncbi:MAG: selenite/tellurite reduction operon b-type cytochrome membrane protein ExtQ [Thermodesulfobacteriota bacterium]
MKNYIRSSPYFYRLLKRTFLLALLPLFGLAALIPAPLQEPANPSRVPNPVKSAWFLLWLQELISYSNYLIYPVAAMVIIFALLPWWAGAKNREHAGWLPREQRLVNCLTLTVVGFIIILTVIAGYFRGENWSFVLPF